MRSYNSILLYGSTGRTFQGLFWLTGNEGVKKMSLASYAQLPVAFKSTGDERLLISK